MLPPVGKLGWLLPPAVIYSVPGSPEALPPPNTMSHNPEFTNGAGGVAVLVSWPKFPGGIERTDGTVAKISNQDPS